MVGLCCVEQRLPQPMGSPGGERSFMDLSFLQLGSDLKKIKSKIEWCVDGLIPFESVTLLTGRGGIGKTWCMLQLASAVSKGEKFLGLNVKQMPVFYIDFENSLPVIIDR